MKKLSFNIELVNRRIVLLLVLLCGQFVVQYVIFMGKARKEYCRVCNALAYEEHKLELVSLHKSELQNKLEKLETIKFDYRSKTKSLTRNNLLLFLKQSGLAIDSITSVQHDLIKITANGEFGAFLALLQKSVTNSIVIPLFLIHKTNNQKNLLIYFQAKLL